MTGLASFSHPPGEGLAASLKRCTADLHRSVDQKMTASDPFSSRGRYADFLALQYRYFQLSSPFYRHPQLVDWFPGLPERDRLGQVAADCRDLGLEPEQLDEPPLPTPANARELAQAVGWLYVNEGSSLGAAFLYTHATGLGFDADCGARHLAAHPEGRGAHWRHFVQRLDTLPLDAAARTHAQEGAQAAFAAVLRLIEQDPVAD